MAEIFGEPLREVHLDDSPLDDFLASRSHVRALRVLTLLGDDINLTGRDVARRAEMSRTRALEVLGELVGTGAVAKYPGATWAIYRIDASNPLASALRALFEAERDLTPA